MSTGAEKTTNSIPVSESDAAPVSVNAPIQKQPPSQEPARAEFRDRVIGMRQENSVSVGINRFPWQSRIVVKELLGLALSQKKPVRQCLSMPVRQFYDEAIYQLYQDIVGEGGSVQIIFTQPLSTTEFGSWKKQIAKLGDRLTVLTMDMDIELHHYCLVGDSAYRLEATHPRWDPSSDPISDTAPERPARFSFNDPDLGKRIEEYDKALTARSKRI